jgi:hypothetical protein
MKNYRLLIIFCLAFYSCYTIPTSIVAPNVDFSRYAFAAIGTNVSGGSAIMDAHMQLQNSLISCGYNLIGDTRIGTLTHEEQSRLFIITMGMSSSVDESVCTINITDYMTGYLLASCKGSFGLGFSITGDQNGAVNSAIKQMEKVIKKNNI